MSLNTKYDRYQVIDELGRGAMGVVYKAFDPRLNRPVALKVMRPDKCLSSEFSRRFIDEAVAIGKLSHQNIVSVFDRGEDHDTLFMAMELLEGQSLKDVIKSGCLMHQDAIKIGVQVAEALGYAHKQGIVHRDIKPSNIIMLENKQIKITDFGIARIEDPEITRNTQMGQIMGTPSYMSPEQATGRPLDGRSDLFSLGVILYEIVTGKKPFTAKTCGATYAAIINHTPKAPHLLNKRIPRQFSQLIMKSIAKDINERFQNGQDLALSLKKCLHRRRSDRGVLRYIPVRLSLKQPSLAAILLLVFIVGIIAVVLWSQSPPKPSAMINVESDPSNASVFINGDWMGSTPIELDLAFGKYEIRLTKADYYHWEAQVNLFQKGPVPIFGSLLPKDNESSKAKE
jgi:serine/threonine protein kinase